MRYIIIKVQTFFTLSVVLIFSVSQATANTINITKECTKPEIVRTSERLPDEEFMVKRTTLPNFALFVTESHSGQALSILSPEKSGRNCIRQVHFLHEIEVSPLPSRQTDLIVNYFSEKSAEFISRCEANADQYFGDLKKIDTLVVRDGQLLTNPGIFIGCDNLLYSGFATFQVTDKAGRYAVGFHWGSIAVFPLNN